MAHASLAQSFGVPDADVLRGAIRVENQAAVALGLVVVQRLFQRIEHEVRAHRTADPPAHDAPGKHIDHDGYLQPAPPREHVREITDPQLIRTLRGTSC